MVYGAFWGKIFLKSYLIKMIKKWAKGDALIFKGSFKRILLMPKMGKMGHFWTQNGARS